MSETPAEAPVEAPAASPVETPVEAPVKAAAPMAAPAAEPAAAAPETVDPHNELAKLIEDARAHLSGGVPQSAVELVIRAVEILAGL